MATFTPTPPVIVDVYILLNVQDSLNCPEQISLKGVTESYVDDTWASFKDEKQTVWNFPVASIAFIKSTPAKGKPDANPQ
jgi:hypothetical protein